MTHHGRRESIEGSTKGAAPDGLASLLDTERELSEEVERAEREAASIIEVAREAARAGDQAFEQELSEALRELEVSEEAATVAAIDKAQREARKKVERLDAVADDRITELADVVVRDFLGIAIMSAGPRK